MKVGIIGSGLSGLTAAALLAKEGYSVTVFEQHEKIGGVTETLEKDGFHWDWGQMIVPDLGEGEPARLILERLGIAEKLEVIKGYRENVFPDFEIRKPKEYTGRLWRKDLLKELFPKDSRGLERYYKIYERIHDLSAMFQKSGLLNKINLLFKFMPLLSKRNWSAQKLMESFFADKKLHAVFTAILADYVASPEIFPGMIIPMINAESQYDERIPLDYDKHQHRSSWTFIKNGCISLVNILKGFILDNGGEILSNTEVTKIELEDNKVNSIKTSDNSEYNVDIVIASGGAQELFFNLIGKEYLPQEYIEKYLDELFTTQSVFMVHLGVDYDPSVYQNGSSLCYYYLTYDIKESIKECQKNIYHEGKDGFLVYIPSKHSPEMAPPGHHAVTVYTIAPNNPVNGNWSEDKERWTEILLDYAEEYIPGLREHEKARIVLTPDDFRNRTHLKEHAFGGTVPHLKIPPPPHETPIDGLWFVGAQSETYGGVTGVMLGSLNVVNTILEGFLDKKKKVKPTISVK
jgi:prolycopene isomerase